MKKLSKVYVAGHSGLVGSALVRKLSEEGYSNIITRTRKELDLTNSKKVATFFNKEKPEYVFLAAAKVGGIVANSVYPAEFIHENILIQDNVIHNAHLSGVKKLLFLGSTCIYPKMSPQPMKEEHLLTGLLESTNEAYAIAKIAGIKTIEAYNKQYGTQHISVMPTNLYGPNDNYHIENSHLFPAIIKKVSDAKKLGKESIELWGTGKPKREFLYADDLADACVFLINNYNGNEGIVNIGYGSDIGIKEFTELVMKVAGYEGKIVHNLAKPDGTPRKLVDSTKLFSMGWRPKITLEEGIARTLADYERNYA